MTNYESSLTWLPGAEAAPQSQALSWQPRGEAGPPCAPQKPTVRPGDGPRMQDGGDARVTSARDHVQPHSKCPDLEDARTLPG